MGESFHGNAEEDGGQAARATSSSSNRHRLFNDDGSPQPQSYSWQGVSSDRWKNVCTADFAEDKDEKEEGSLGLAIANAYNPRNLSNETLYQLSKATGEMSGEYAAAGQARMRSAREAWSAPVDDALAAETGVDQGTQRMAEEAKVGEELEREGASLKIASKLLKWGAFGADVGESVKKVVEAPPAEREREAMIESAGFVGGRFAAGACEKVLERLAPESVLLSLVAIPIADVGCEAGGRYLAEEWAKETINDEGDKNKAPGKP